MIRRAARILAVPAVALLLASCSGTDVGGSRASDERWPQWDETANAAEVSEFMKVAVPEGATEAKGAVQVNPREDVYLLSFVTSEENAEEIAKDLRSEEPLEDRKADFAPQGERFGHLGLPEPETVEGARWVGVCPPCVGDKRRSKMQWIEVYVQTLDADRARVYLQAF
ncbi:hypothetical protein ACGFZG_01615 [Streptomyces antibioticus]|uniref:hypothetical protein n=1 Tax=Streptomyces antibioticus TaxID=1890 RepID=UPI0036F9DFF3